MSLRIRNLCGGHGGFILIEGGHTVICVSNSLLKFLLQLQLLSQEVMALASVVV